MRAIHVAVASALFSLIACGCGMRQDRMVPNDLHVVHQHAGSVSVSANIGDTGGSRAWTASNLATKTDMLSKATEETIKKYGVFTDVKPAGQSDYALVIRYTNVDEPAFGFNFQFDLSQ